MISIIICSKSKDISTSLAKNIHDTIGCEYELVVVDNSENQYSIFSAYNLGVEKSNFQNLCFVHEDVEFVTENWGKKIIDHLNLPNVGLIGLAGGKAALRVPLGWTTFGLFYNITHPFSDKKNNIIDIKETFPLIHQNSESIVLLDGVFICAKSELFAKIKFDETIGEFHGYDQDISLQAICAGYYNFVVYDIDLKHFSKGIFDTNYISALLSIYEKWKNELPIFEKSYTQKEIEEISYKAEKSALQRLRKGMVRARMSYSETYSTIRKLTLLTGNNLDKFFLFLLPFELFFIRFTSIIRMKMIYQKKLN